MIEFVLEIIKYLGAAVRFLVFYPFNQRPLNTYIDDKQGEESQTQDTINMILGILILILLVLTIKIFT